MTSFAEILESSFLSSSRIWNWLKRRLREIKRTEMPSGSRTFQTFRDIHSRCAGLDGLPKHSAFTVQTLQLAECLHRSQAAISLFGDLLKLKHLTKFKIIKRLGGSWVYVILCLMMTTNVWLSGDKCPLQRLSPMWAASLRNKCIIS